MVREIIIYYSKTQSFVSDQCGRTGEYRTGGHTFYKVSIIQHQVETNRANILQIWHEIERLASSSELGKISNFSGILNSQYCPTQGDEGCPWVRLTINFIGEFPLI